MEKDTVVLAYLIPQKQSEEKIPVKFGGSPCWMYNHNIKQFECQLCKQQLTFLCQVYAPLNEVHNYHRALYLFFCSGDKCQNNKKGFQVFRMQLSESQELNPFWDQTTPYRRLKEEYLVQTDITDSHTLKSMGQKILREARENQDDDDGDSDVQQSSSNVKLAPVSEEEDMDGIEQMVQKRKLEPIFQIYKGTLAKLDYPVLIYASIPLEFKDQHVNVKQKKCSTCKGPMKFQFQVNSCVLEKFQQLMSYDWGTIQVYTCRDSCKGDRHTVFKEDVEVQIEEDTALNKQEINRKLQEIEAQRVKKQKKKDKKRQKREQKKTQKQQGSKQAHEQENQKESEDVEGDWD